MEITRGKWVAKGVLGQVDTTRNAKGQRGGAFAYRVDYSRGEFQGFGFAGLVGKADNARLYGSNPITSINYEDSYDSRSKVMLFEVDGYFIRGDWTVQGQISLGRQKYAAITPDPVTGELRDAAWTGLSTLVAYKFMPRLEGVTRFDYIRNHKNGGGLLGWAEPDDINGIGPQSVGDEAGANRYAISLGLNYLWDLNTSFKLEVRQDFANLPVFGVEGGANRKRNTLLGASVVVSF